MALVEDPAPCYGNQAVECLMNPLYNNAVARRNRWIFVKESEIVRFFVLKILHVNLLISS